MTMSTKCFCQLVCDIIITVYAEVLSSDFLNMIKTACLKNNICLLAVYDHAVAS